MALDVLPACSPLLDTTSEELDLEALFGEAQIAWELEDRTESLSKRPRLSPVDDRLAIEKDHVCGFGVCDSLQLNKDSIWVCAKTGVCFSGELVDEIFDNQLSRRSANPDDSAGVCLYASFRGRRDAAAASHAATVAAQELETDENSEEYVAPVEIVREQRRGALCVGETECKREKKRSRTCRRDVDDNNGRRALVEDAMNCVNKLLNQEARRDAVLAESAHAKLASANVTDLRDQLQKRYMKDCATSGTRPNLHKLFDIAIGAQEAIRNAQRQVRYEQSRCASQVGVEFREQMSNLAVALWLSSCQTPYMKALTKADGFRAFVSGVLYGTRRGFALSTGQALIPCCPELADVLPNLRMASKSSVKALQASSHRGLCTLTRSINSLANDSERLKFYQTSILIAAQIKKK